MIRFLFLIACLSVSAASGAQTLDYEKKLFINNNDTLPYRILLPKNYNPKKKYPLLLFLHGAGERGNDNEKQLTHGGRIFLTDSFRQTHPAIVVFPQCPETSYWSNVKIVTNTEGKRSFVFPKAAEPTLAMNLLLGLLYKLEETYKITTAQRYVMGLSMGGMGTFELAQRMPKYFDAAVPICGGGAVTDRDALLSTNWWIFHGAKDDVVPLGYSMSMYKAIYSAGTNAKLTVYCEAGHNSWDRAFLQPGLWDWLFMRHGSPGPVRRGPFSTRVTSPTDPSSPRLKIYPPYEKCI